MPSSRAEARVVRHRMIIGLGVSNEGPMAMPMSMAASVPVVMAVAVTMIV